MKLLFCTLTLRPYLEPASRERGIPSPDERRRVWDWLVAHGFDGIDLGETWLNFYDAPDDELVAVGQEVRDHGLAIGAVTVLRKIITPPADEHVQIENRRKLRRAVEAAALVGAPIVNMSISPEPWQVKVREQDLRGQADPVASSTRADEEDYRIAAEFLASLALDAEQQHIGLTLELHQNSIIDTPDRMLHLLRHIDHPNVKVNPDLGNFYFAFATPPCSWEDAVTQLARHTDFWHVKNIQRVYVESEDRAYLINAPLDQGMIDYRRALRMMAAQGFDGWISIEMAGPGDPFACILAGKEYLVGLLREIGKT
ncbi:MAG: sugar phosphate isomerase/epimerase [Candidatus Latescibacteria bacterium]|nr:sugar phosphate isomerase/epimerase [Candidatus Latescibacterota bacterium]